MKVEISGSRKKMPFPLAKIRKKTNRILELLDLKDKSLSIFLADDRTIRRLNLRYLKKDRATDVLAFSMIEGTPLGKSSLLGDVVVSVDTARKSAKYFGKSFEEEFYLYIIHGILHLVGYRDDNTRRRKIMEVKQEKILKKLK